MDESMISGEPVPVAKGQGASLLAGTINQKGSLKMRAKKVGGATLLAQIVQAVQEARRQQGARATAGGQGRGGLRAHRDRDRHPERHRLVGAGR